VHLVGFYYKKENLTLGKLLLPLSGFVVSNVIGDKTQLMISKALIALLIARRNICCSPALLLYNFKFVLPHNLNQALTPLPSIQGGVKS